MVLLYTLIDEDFKVRIEADAMLVKVMELRNDDRFRDDFATDDYAVHEILHTFLYGGDYSSIVDGSKKSDRDTG